MRKQLIHSLYMLLAACETSKVPFSLTVDATGVTTIRGDLDEGDLDYEGEDGAGQFDITGISAGAGSNATKAEEREAGNSWSAEAQDGVLDLRTRSAYERAWVDLNVVGPAMMDVEVSNTYGQVSLTNMSGVFVLDVSSFTGRALVGDADVLCSGGVDLEIWPDTAGLVWIESTGGNVRLALPWGGPYDIEVWGSTEYEWSITDLGFDRISYGEGTFDAETGDASIEIKVIVENGTFTLKEAW